MGRTLQNTMINLGLQNACDEAVYQVSIPGGQCGPTRGELGALQLLGCPCFTTLAANCSLSILHGQVLLQELFLKDLGPQVASAA